MEHDIFPEWPEEFAGLAGSTRAYNEAHTTARIALLRWITNLESWRDTQLRILETPGLLDKVEAAATTNNEVRQVIGDTAYDDLINRADVIRYPPDVDVSLAQSKIDAACDAMVAFLHSYSVCYETAQTAIIAYAKDELRLPWAWVALELSENFHAALWGYALGLEMTKNFWFEPLSAPAPDVRLTFETTEGETVSQAIERLLVDTSKAIEELSKASEAGSLPPGKTLSTDNIDRHVEWLCRNRLDGESIRSISNNPGDGEPHRDRTHIRYGIKQAEGLLSISYAFWDEVPDEEIDRMTKGFLASSD